MKFFLLIFTALVFSSCSFDNKTGIWIDASDIPSIDNASKPILENENNTRYEDIFTKNQTFNEEKKAPNISNVEIDKSIRIANWSEQYSIPTNNVSNFFFNGNKILLSKSSRLKKDNLKKKIVFFKDNFISHDHKGTIYIYSLSLNKKIFEYNFYKKNFKNFKKKISFIINGNILYAADNLGYLYALNLNNNSIIWAKNYGIPFRSNLKFLDNQIFLANQDNVIYSIDSKTGETNWQFSTSQSFLKSDFENNFALDLVNSNLFFLNTNGELYSVNLLTKKINWVLNFKNSASGGEAELFQGRPLVIKNDSLIVTTEKALLSYNNLTASRNWNFSSEPIFKPIETTGNTFILLKNNLLVCLDSISGGIIWSKNIFKDIEKKKTINKFGKVVDFKVVNSEISIYSSNGYLLSINPKNGKLNSLTRISKNGISSEIFFLNDLMFLVDSKNKLLKFN